MERINMSLFAHSLGSFLNSLMVETLNSNDSALKICSIGIESIRLISSWS